MRLQYLGKSTTAPPLATDTARMVRAHRDNTRHRRIIAAYRAAHPLCERCIAEGRTAATAEIHHIQHVAEGGATANENLLAACDPCHRTIDEVPKEQQRAWKALGIGAQLTIPSAGQVAGTLPANPTPEHRSIRHG
jgi:hypothetical protein